MDINNWITFEANEKGASDSEELEGLVQERLAKQIQSRLRNQVDPGIDLKSARRAQSIRAQANGGSIVIDEDDQGKVLTGSRDDEESEAEPPATNLDDLFKPGSGVPEAVTRPDGSTQLVFRSIKASDLFSQQAAARQTETVAETISDVLRTQTVEAFDEAFDEIGRRHPELNRR